MLTLMGDIISVYVAVGINLLLAYVKNDDFNFPNCELSIFM
jgi:hypothetical protein